MNRPLRPAAAPRALTLCALCALFIGCGPAVTPLALDDSRLPRETRRFVGDAEDAVTVARARVSDARAERRSRAAARDALLAAPPFPGAGPAMTATTQQSALADARVDLADAALEAAEAALALAEARLTLTYAESAVRHDLAVYDLAPLRARVEAARDAALAAEDTARLRRQAVEDATTAWWTAWRGYLAAGGDARAYWIER